jgi:hypothetical protein
LRSDHRPSTAAFPLARHREFAATLRLKMACLTLPLTLGMAGCSSVPLSETGTLSSYERLGEAKGKFGKARSFADGQALSNATSVSISPTTYTHGGLAVEAEVLDRNGVQRGAIVWSRGANSITNGARVSEVGDAYSLAYTFADQYSEMLVTGEEPAELRLKLPSAQRLQSMLGGKPKYAACEAFGRSPGLAEVVGAKFGAPPSWTDKAPQPAGPPQTADATLHTAPAQPQ